MKKLFASAVLVALALTSNAVSAQDLKPAATVTEAPLNLKVEEIKPLQFKVVVENPSRQKLNIVLEDKNKGVLFEDFSGDELKYAKVLDLSNVIDGTYTFIVNGRKEKISKSFEIVTSTNRVAVAKSDK